MRGWVLRIPWKQQKTLKCHQPNPLFFFFDDRMCSHAVVIIVGRRKLHLGFENPTVTGWSAKLIAQTICFLVQDKLVLGSYHGDLFSCPQHNRGL